MDALVSAKDIARLLGVSVSTVERLAREGKLTKIRVSKRLIRYEMSEVRRLAGQDTPAGGEGHASV